MKLAFVVQRYGREILGGSETLARQLAERLGRKHDITVLTTTAKDYITWKNEYEPGEEKQRGVRVIRFPVEGERNLEEFNKFSEEIYKAKPTREQELEWLERQGPVTPELVEHLKKEHHRYDQIIFFTYLYYPTFYGLQVAPDKSMLLPTAHDEPPLRLSIFREMFDLPNAFLFNTEAEEMLVLDRFAVHKKMRETIGVGMELLDAPDGSLFRKKHNLSSRYFLYAGRIDAGKGLEELFRFFTFYKEEHPETGNLQLVLIGKLGMKLPDDPSIHYAGFVDESEKLSAMGGAIAVIQPSRMESLSIVTLESFAVGTPVIASSGSKVLVDHCRRANAGFYYGDFEEFEEIVSLLLSSKDLGRGLGKNGQRYVKENYGWQKLLSKYELALRSAARPARDAVAPSPSESKERASTPPEKRRDDPPPKEQARTEDARHEARKDEASKDEASKDEASKDEAAKHEAPKDEAAKDEAAKDDGRKDDGRKDDGRKDDGRKDDRKEARSRRRDRDEPVADKRPRREAPESAAPAKDPTPEPAKAAADPSEDETLIDARATVAGAILGSVDAEPVGSPEPKQPASSDQMTSPTDSNAEVTSGAPRPGPESQKPAPEPEEEDTEGELPTQPMPIQRRPESAATPPAPETEPVEAAKEPEAAAEPLRPEPPETDETPEIAEPAEPPTPAEPVNEDVEHLPSFFQASVPLTPAPATPAPKARPTVRTPPPPPSPPLKDGELPAFFKPRPSAVSDESEAPVESAETVEAGASEPHPSSADDASSDDGSPPATESESSEKKERAEPE